VINELYTTLAALPWIWTAVRREIEMLPHLKMGLRASLTGEEVKWPLPEGQVLAIKPPVGSASAESMLSMMHRAPMCKRLDCLKANDMR
jgi:hypothetical protein